MAIVVVEFALVVEGLQQFLGALADRMRAALQFGGDGFLRGQGAEGDRDEAIPGGEVARDRRRLGGEGVVDRAGEFLAVLLAQLILLRGNGLLSPAQPLQNIATAPL